MKKIMIFLLTSFLIVLNLKAEKISYEECTNLGEDYIFAGGECIQTVVSKGETESSIIILVHGTWPEGTNILGRYTTFAETLAMSTDITTVAIALPGYSGSSTNNFLALGNKEASNLSGQESYVRFVGEVVKALKEKFDAEKITYVGHSAGARIGATLTGLEPNLIQNIALVGGRYENKLEEKGKGLIALADVIDKVNMDTNFLFIYGTADKISTPEVTTSFYEKAVEKGLKAKLVKVEGAPHLDLEMTNKSVESIVGLVEE